MRRFRFAALAAVAATGFASAASAADLPVKAPVASIAAPSWTGWYMGLNAGGNWGTSQTSTTVGSSSVAPVWSNPALNVINALGAPTDTNTSGFTGGLQGGYNYQMGQWLVGVEADFNYFRSAGSNSTSINALGSTFNLTSSVSTDWLFTLRPRLGFISNNWLIYATGGLAVTQLKATWNFSDTLTPSSESASASSTKAGWVVGGGIETMLPEKWIIGAEYLYVNFGSVSATSFAVIPAGTITNPYNHTADLSANIVRARLSKLF